jgi:predicted secreted hydrolase
MLASEASFPQAEPNYDWQFPDDHLAHPQYKTEWWYFTGEVETADRRFGYQFTIFRRRLGTRSVAGNGPWATDQMLTAHLALSDLSSGQYYRDYFSSRLNPEFAAADTTAPGTVALRTIELNVSNPWKLRATTENFSLDLELEARNEPLFHGQNGFSRKGPKKGQASQYYSQTRMKTNGTISTNDGEFAVHGRTWFDHEFGSSQLNENQVGWDWLSLRLRDDRDLMLFRIREDDGTLSEESAVTLRDGDSVRTGSLGDTVVFRPHPDDGRWTSPQTEISYPLRWSLKLPDRDEPLLVEPVMNDQEMIVPGNVVPPYWEGLIQARTPEGTVVGSGYLELTGYGGSVAETF